jgi:hypothetical protein
MEASLRMLVARGRIATMPMQRAKGKESATNDWQSWQPPKIKRGSRTDLSASLVVPFENPMAGYGSELEPVRAIFHASFGSETEH